MDLENEERLERRPCTKLPQIEVRFEELSAKAEIGPAQRALPTLFNYSVNAAKELVGLLRLSPAKRKQVNILDGISGTIRPSRMTLILGPPASGKSTFLQALAGKLDPSLKIKGRVTYNNKDLSHFIPQRTCSYVSQYDLHHPEMTVRETLTFSGSMLGNVEAYDLLEELVKRNKGENIEKHKNNFSKVSIIEPAEQRKSGVLTDYIISMLGLQECADVIIGDEMRRGISGGQKKRVTIGEMLVGLSRCFFMDDISTGLDSSTTFDIITFLRNLTHTLDITTAISLLQPDQETFDLFDDIILLCEGKIVYQGPRENVLEFFESMGFKCPERKNIADFLQEVISMMDQAQYWVHDQDSYQYIPVKQFSESFQSFHLGRFYGLKSHERYQCRYENESTISSNGKYNLSKIGIFKTCFSREWLLMKRNLLIHIFKNIQIAVLGFVIMTVFFRTQMKHNSIADGYRYMGAIIAGVVIVKFNGMTELAMTIKRLPIFYKQRELLFLPSWALLSSIFLLSLPVSLLEAGIWTSLTYYVIGFAPSPIRFLLQFLSLFCVHQMSMGIFRFIAVVARTQLRANILGTAALIAIYILGGFVISKDDIQPWLAWGNWMSPLTYAQNAVAINEFLDNRWNKNKIPYGNTTSTIGKAVLKSRGMLTEAHWFWICVAALLGYSILFNFFSLFALAYLNAPCSHQSNIIRRKDPKKTAKTHEQKEVGKPPQIKTALPFQPLTLAFSHINYYVDTPVEMIRHGYTEKRLQLLRDVSGAFRPGILTALMGVTGAGKTTLLDVLAGRKTGGYIEGDITISGYPKRQETFARISGYCEQNDNHSPFVTVQESLQYSAWLRLPANIDTRERNMFVEEVMDLVELTLLKDAIVGVPGVHGLSAEQRKRLTIAVELVASPSIIFMDEPTTGLDARAAAIVMRTVRKTVDTGRTVVCTIHQPSIEIFEAFDELLLMKRGGQLIYGGSLGALSQNMIQYFQRIQGIPNIRDGQNPAAWMLEVSSCSIESKLGIDYADIYRKSSLFKKNSHLVDELSKTRSSMGDLYFPTKYVRSFKSQCIACLWKQHMSYWKNPEHNVVRIIITIATSLLFGLVFWNIGSNIKKEQDVFNVLGIAYGSAMFLGFASTSLVQPVVGMERIVFYRERAAGMYSSLPYAMAQVAVEIPYITLQVLIFSIIVYPMVGFQFEQGKFLWFLLFMLLSFIYFTLFGIMTAALTPSQEIAALFSFFLYVLWNIFSGFFIPRTMIPTWWRWFYWANPPAWTIHGLMVSQLGSNTNFINIPGKPDQSVQKFLQEYFGFENKFLPLIVIVHIVFIILFLSVFSLGIKHLKFQRR